MDAEIIRAMVVTGGVSLVGCPAVGALLRRHGILDTPGRRSSHTVPTPRGAGVAVGLGSILGYLLAPDLDDLLLGGLVLGGIGLGLVGLIDDLHSTSVLPRFVAQVALASVAVPLVMSQLTDTNLILLVGAVVGVGWVVAYVNSFNFMDGLDGLSAVTTVVAGGTIALVGGLEGVGSVVSIGLVTAAAALGFLPWNFPKARLFLGDVGSYFLGAVLAIAAIVALGSSIPPEAVAGPFLVYIADTSFTLLRRMLRREEWWEAHRQHRYQQLTTVGVTQTTVTLLVGAFTVVCSGLGLISLTGDLLLRLMALILSAAVLFAYLRLPGVLYRRAHRPTTVTPDVSGPSVRGHQRASAADGAA